MKKDNKTHQNYPKNYPIKFSIKWVKKANQWCKTTFKDKKQIQEWSSNKSFK